MDVITKQIADAGDAWHLASLNPVMQTGHRLACRDNLRLGRSSVCIVVHMVDDPLPLGQIGFNLRTPFLGICADFVPSLVNVKTRVCIGAVREVEITFCIALGVIILDLSIKRDRLGHDDCIVFTARQDLTGIYPFGTCAVIPIVPQRRAIDNLRIGMHVEVQTCHEVVEHGRHDLPDQAVTNEKCITHKLPNSLKHSDNPSDITYPGGSHKVIMACASICRETNYFQ